MAASFYFAFRLKNMSVFKAIAKFVRPIAVTLGMACFLFLYLIGSVPVESFHSLLHRSENHELHQGQQESDPCHLRVFHAISSEGCDHKVHLTKESKCPVSMVQLLSSHLVGEESVFLSTHSPSTFFTSIGSGLAGLPLSNIQGRAPPQS